MKLTRRTVLTLAGLAALGITIPACRQMLRQMLFSPEATPASAPPPVANPFRAGDKSLVAIVHGDDVPAMVRRAVELIGGIDRLGLRPEDPREAQRRLGEPAAHHHRPSRRPSGRGARQSGRRQTDRGR